METIPITFCNRGCNNIISNRFKSNILKKIYNSFGISINDSNKIYSERYNSSLHKFKHAVSYITGGSKYFLLLTNIKNINYAIYIQKKLIDKHKFPKMILSNYRFDQSLYNNTIFEGELIKTYNNNWSFRITDIPVYKNKLINSKKLYEKIKIINNVLQNMYIYDANIQTCPLILAKFYSYSDLDSIIKDIPKYNYKIIGIVFRSIEKNISINFLFDKRYIEYNKVTINYLINIDSYNNSLMNVNKLMNESNSNSIINKVVIGNNKIKNKYFLINTSDYPEVYNLHTVDKQYHSVARIDTLETAAYLRNICRLTKFIKILCKYDHLYNKWIPIIDI